MTTQKITVKDLKRIVRETVLAEAKVKKAKKKSESSLADKINATDDVDVFGIVQTLLQARDLISEDVGQQLTAIDDQIRDDVAKLVESLDDVVDRFEKALDELRAPPSAPESVPSKPVPSTPKHAQAANRLASYRMSNR